jgi:hypothetical protein
MCQYRVKDVAEDLGSVTAMAKLVLGDLMEELHGDVYINESDSGL